MGECRPCRGPYPYKDAAAPPIGAVFRVLLKKYNMVVEDANTFQMTGGAALAVHIEKDIASASSFPCGEKNKWYPWCEQATASHQAVVTELAKRRVSGPWWHPTVGTWFFSIRGVAYAKM